ncbi:YadA-like family protein [Bartonella sp. CL266QHHD]|uniref:YadA-like family protein n=1 Tax=Bartonella sp. CL266QHHD TaxID=3243519 RepID=UPI0035D07B95
MKKILYTTPHTLAVSNLKNSCSSYRLPFIKTLSLVSVAAFLSSASPVFACDLWGNVAQYFGGGTNIRKSIAPTYIINGKIYRDVGSALYGLENYVAETRYDKFVKQDASGLITIGADVGGNRITIANSSHGLRTLTGVADGWVSPISYDAVNGSQLFSQGISTAISFGGGAGYDRKGNWIAPTFTVKVFDKNGNGTEKDYKNVADAFTGVSSSFTNLDAKIENIKVASNSLVKQDDTGLISIGGEVSGTKVSIANVDNAVRTLTGVKAGSITAVSTDAINGSQLYSMSNVVAGYFGGGAGYKDGNWSAPTFTVKVFDKNGNGTEKDYKNVADAFTGVSSSFTNLDKKIENIVIDATGNSLVKQDDTGLISIGGEVSGTKVSIANVDNAVRTLSGVKAGSITAASTDAINGSQLYSMSNVVAGYFGGGAGYKDGNLSAPTFTVKVFDKNGNGTEKDYKNVADAFTGVSSSYTNLDKKIENIVIDGTGDNLVKQDDTGLITIGGEVSGTKVSVANVDNAVRTLSGVKAGSITAASTDAINGSQLYSMSNVVAGYFGGGAGYKDGNWSAPTFTVKVFDKNGNGTEKDYKNVADAFTGVSSSFTYLDKKIENIVIDGTGDNLVKQDDTGLITIGGKVSGARVNIANVDNVARTLAGVKAGSITATSTDAINGSQFYAMSNVVAGYFSDNAGYDKDGNWNAPTFTVKVFDKNGSGTEKNYKNVGDALSGVSSSFTNLNQKIESVTGDSFVKQNSAGLITIGGDKGGNRIDIANSVNFPRVLSGVKGGAFTATSTEAVNGGQIYLMTQAFASYFGGGAGYDKAGKWSAPTFTVKAFDKDGNETEKNYTNVADAFSGVNSALAGLNHQVVEIKSKPGIEEKNKPSQTDSSDIISEGFPFMRSLPSASGNVKVPTTITVAPKSPLKQVSFMSSEGESRRLFDIAAGEISETSTDAITGSQLYSINNQIATYFGGGSGYKGGNWSAPTFTVKAFDKDGHEIDKEYTNVADAFAGVNSALAGLNHQVVDIKNGLGVGETESKSLDGDPSDIFSEGFPFMRSARFLRSLPLAIDEEESAIDEADNSTTVTVAPSEILEKSTYEVTDSQLQAVDRKVDGVIGRVTEVEKKVNVAVSYDTDKEGKKTNSITLKGVDDSEPVLITNVQDGKIEHGSKDAVNGGQLYDHTAEQMKITLESAKEYTKEQVDNGVNEAKSYTDMKFDALSYDITNVRKEARQAAAIGLAVSNLRYFDDPGSVSVSFGGGFWRGQSAFAIGAGYTSEDGKIRSNLSATSAGGQWGVGGGITLKLK